MLRIDIVVFSMCSYEPNVQNLNRVIGVYDKSVLVAATIENDAISLRKTGMRVCALDVFRAFPSGLRCLPIPRLKWMFGSPILFPKYR